MNHPHKVLLTDLYQLTMAYGYWQAGRAEEEAVFYLYYRKNPFQGTYTIAAGLGLVIEFLQELQFDEAACQYLASLQGNDGKPLFAPAFLDYLQTLAFTVEIDAVPEGTVMFPHAPLLRVKGSLLQAQILETPLLNLINFSTLIATKASRIKRAAGADPVLEFGLRRAQGPDGGMSASRAAYIGGVDATSNVLAGMQYGIPVRGTHAHSWVMSYGEEQTAFDAYAAAMPNNCILLVDTYDTLNGVRKAIETGIRLRQSGHEMVGIRLDSGDLVALSRAARAMLDEAGFPEAKVVASNDLDEYAIQRLKAEGAQIDIWGIGTRLATAFDQPALGGVYKLAAHKPAGQDWQYTMKLSNQAIKNSLPGQLQTLRMKNKAGQFVGDVIYNELAVGTMAQFYSLEGKEVYELDETTRETLLVPVFRAGKLVYQQPPLSASRQNSFDQLAALAHEVQVGDEDYLLGISPQLHVLRERLKTAHLAEPLS